jgi:hypothetical protein
MFREWLGLRGLQHDGPEAGPAGRAGRLLALRPELPVILCSGYGELIDKKELAKIGSSSQCPITAP